MGHEKHAQHSTPWQPRAKSVAALGVLVRDLMIAFNATHFASCRVLLQLGECFYHNDECYSMAAMLLDSPSLLLLAFGSVHPAHV